MSDRTLEARLPGAVVVTGGGSGIGRAGGTYTVIHRRRARSRSSGAPLSPTRTWPSSIAKEPSAGVSSSGTALPRRRWG
jgi:hypothetical protein